MYVALYATLMRRWRRWSHTRAGMVTLAAYYTLLGASVLAEVVSVWLNIEAYYLPLWFVILICFIPLTVVGVLQRMALPLMWLVRAI